MNECKHEDTDTIVGDYGERLKVKDTNSHSFDRKYFASMQYCKDCGARRFGKKIGFDFHWLDWELPAVWA